jgi:hypothetical protein
MNKKFKTITYQYQVAIQIRISKPLIADDLWCCVPKMLLKTMFYKIKCFTIGIKLLNHLMTPNMLHQNFLMKKPVSRPTLAGKGKETNKIKFSPLETVFAVFA